MKTFLASLTALALFAPSISFAASATTSPAFPTVITQGDIQAKYAAAGLGGPKVKILIMPGHEPGYGGAEEGGLKEREIAVTISNKLAADLAADPRLEVTVARTDTAWLPALSEYFESEWKNIQKFVASHKKAMQKLQKSGKVIDRSFEVEHNTAPSDVAYRLYGITKWANEEGYDLVIHPHLNYNVGAQFQSGFAVYVPDAQYGNAAASRPLGEDIMEELERIDTSSTLPIETYGLVEDQDLIALGAYNTANYAVALIEYAYIYESKIMQPGARDSVLADMAWETYRGIEKYLGAALPAKDTTVLPFAWQQVTIKQGDSTPEIYALQVALHKAGFYPPAGQLLVGCPISGYAGDCTVTALKAFQKSKGLEQTGSIGPRTIAALKKLGF
jgi:N-acetylmuramoyl-L-alanine amidase